MNTSVVYLSNQPGDTFHTHQPFECPGSLTSLVLFMNRLADIFNTDVLTVFKFSTETSNQYTSPVHEHTAIVVDDVQTETEKYKESGHQVDIRPTVTFVKTADGVLEIMGIGAPPHDAYKVVTKPHLDFLRKLFAVDTVRWKLVGQSPPGDEMYVIFKHKSTAMHLQLIWRVKPLFE